MPDELKKRIQDAADQAGRSLHGELLHRLQNSFETDSAFTMVYELKRTQLRLEMNEISAKLQQLYWRERELRQLIEELDRTNMPAEGLEKPQQELVELRREILEAKDNEKDLIMRLVRLDGEYEIRFPAPDDSPD